MKIDRKLSKNLCQYQSLYPTQSNRIKELAMILSYEEVDDNATIVASNCSTNFEQLECVNAITFAASHAIADTGATSIFIMKGTPVKIYNGQIIPSRSDYQMAARFHLCTFVTSIYQGYQQH